MFSPNLVISSSLLACLAFIQHAPLPSICGDGLCFPGLALIGQLCGCGVDNFLYNFRSLRLLAWACGTVFFLLFYFLEQTLPASYHHEQ
jgi:hypothetical protein